LDIVMVMGIQGAGKSVHVRRFVDSGYERLNRDERGGTLRGLARALDERLHAGGTRFVLDNTYLTRALRSHVLDVARTHGATARCIWLDTPLEAAQRNAVWRLLERHGHLPEPDELAQLARQDPNTFAPTVQLRSRRELEPPDRDEGFDEIEIVSFTRSADPGAERAGLALAWDALGSGAPKAPRELPDDAPVLVFAFSDEALDGAVVSERLGRQVELAICGHGGGPPRCWCRPPLPGLILPWQRRQRIDPARSLLIGASPAHRRIADTLGFAYRDGI
jgi:predicted kinase